MKYLKLFEQFDEWDPFGEEKNSSSEIKVGDELYYSNGDFMGEITEIEKDLIFYVYEDGYKKGCTLRGMIKDENIKRK